MRTLLTVCLTLLLTLVVIPADVAEASTPDKPEVIAVKFHADWCGSCKKMGSVFEDLRNKYDGRPILFVTLDLTNGTTKGQSELMASALGFSDVYAQNHNKTGFVLLLDGQTRKPLAKLTADQNIKAMGAEMVKHLSR